MSEKPPAVTEDTSSVAVAGQPPSPEEPWHHLYAGTEAAHASSPAVKDRRGYWWPTWALVSTRLLELRKRRGLMFVTLLLTLGLPFIFLGFRLLFHAVDPKSYGPAGSPSVFINLCLPMAEFGFIIAATLGATAGSTDLTEGVFRHLVVTGRSRLALYFARIPAGLSILVPLVAVAFAAVCLVTSYEGIPQPTSLNENGVSVPLHLSESQLRSWMLQNPQEAAQAFINGPVILKPGPGEQGPNLQGPQQLTNPQIRSNIDKNISTYYSQYVGDETTSVNPAMNEMVKVGLWLELEVIIGFMVGLGLGSLIGQRTVSTILMIVLEIILTPILASNVIPYFINGQRLIVGVAMVQLRPIILSGGTGGAGHGRAILGGRALGIPPMPTWAMVAVIVGWIVGWTVIGAWRMATRDA